MNILMDESGSMPPKKPFIDFGNGVDLTDKTNEEILEHLLTAEEPILIVGEAVGFVMNDGEGPKPSIEDIRNILE
jgi:hypothetical protein